MHNALRGVTRLCLGFSVPALLTAAVYAADNPPRPLDPFDYSYCGGQPVYPVIGVNFSTFCGPRNQIALGRRGKLMWIFPAADGRRPHAQGTRMLSQAELKRLSLLAEVTQFANPSRSERHGMNYQMGIDFQGRPYRRLHAVLTDEYTPANDLVRAMLALVPDQPLLPDCDPDARFYDPTSVPGDRASLPEPPRAGLSHDRSSR